MDREGGASSSSSSANVAAQCRSSEKMIGARVECKNACSTMLYQFRPAYVITGSNRSIIRAHWSGPRLFLSAEEYPRYVISVRGIVIMYFVSNTGRRSKRIDIRWIELTRFAYDSLFLFRETKERVRSRGKMDGRRRTVLSSESIFDRTTFYARRF